ncbi:hypothetical protein [Litchfieldella rifensis]|uniref:Uncharacterized protein n=1 Tax=Litchfieldella rifensis TaxID=762643 RepID=A0ABV7LQW7_9GAMM
MTSPAHNDFLPPFPRLGECYRLLSNALGTKGGDRDVDRLAREGDYDWRKIPVLQQRLISRPLRDKSSDEFADYVMATVEVMHEEYIGMVRNISVDALTRADTLPVLIEKCYAPRAASFLLNLSQGISGPNLNLLLDTDRNPIDVVFTWLEQELGVASGQLGIRLYPESVGENKNYREYLKRWREGEPLPSLVSIARLQRELQESFPERKSLAGVFIEWLITARALAFFEARAESHAELRRLIFREVLADAPPVDIGLVLSHINIASGNRLQSVCMSGLLLFEDLKLKSSKSQGDMERTRLALEQFRKLQEDQDQYGVGVYFTEWLSGRWHILAGDFQRALPCYEEAVKLSLYRSGKNLGQILKEAVFLAAKQKKLPMYKRLKHLALTLDISIYSIIDGAGDNQREIQLLASNFDLMFPERGRFPESRMSEQ